METGLSLGSNLNDRFTCLRQARDRIAELPGVQMVAQSPVYETEPMDVPAEFNNVLFLNAVLILTCSQSPAKMAAIFRDVEREMGREQDVMRNTPRIVDVDMIYADQLELNDENIILPHPRWAERRFVVQPLADVRPDLVLPRQTRTVREVLFALPPTPKVVLYRKDW